jgi:hypothetical protein
MSSNKPTKPDKASNKPAVKRTADEVKTLLSRYKVDIVPEHILMKAAELWTEYEQAPNDKKKLELEPKLNKQLENAAVILTLDQHIILAESLNSDKYRTLVIEIANQLVKEYECKTSSEKMLAQTAAWAYCRMLEYANKLNGITRQEYLSSVKTGHYAVLSKEVDRCVRQYLSALNTLKHFKQPSLSVTFKAQNAFVAQNQQINADRKPETKEQNNVGQ